MAAQKTALVTAVRQIARYGTNSKAIKNGCIMEALKVLDAHKHNNDAEISICDLAEQCCGLDRQLGEALRFISSLRNRMPGRTEKCDTP
jgi:hypothetical protein